MSTAVELTSAIDIAPSGLSCGEQADALADIFDPGINLAVWQRSLDPALQQAVTNYLRHYRFSETRLVLAPDQVGARLLADLPEFVGRERLVEDVELLVDMFCCLFELEAAGVRLTVLDRAMCPKFHVDRVVCRLVTSYNLIGTDWLPNTVIDRSKLGIGTQGLADSESGLYRTPTDIQTVQPGDVALLKGESWPDNNNRGLVHRSPEISGDTKRLILTLDA